MSTSNVPRSRPPMDVAPTEQPSMSTIPPTPLVETASEEVFDSRDNPGVRQYLATSIRRPRGPRKSAPKPTNRDLSSSTSTTGTETSYVTAFDSPASSQDGSEDDEVFRQRRKRPHSGVIGISPLFTWDELAQQLATATDQCNQLIKLKFNLERKIECNTTLIEELQEALKVARTAKKSLELRTVSAEKELAVLQDTHHEIMSRNAELEGLNKVLRKKTAQAESNEERCRLLNNSIVNQMTELKEGVFKEATFINQLREYNAYLMKERDVALAEAQRARDDQDFLASRDEAYQELSEENSALKREIETVRSHIDEVNEQQNGLQDDLWKYDRLRTANPNGSNASARGSWNLMAVGQALQGQKLIDTPALTHASTSSRPSLASPQSVTISAGGSNLVKPIYEVMLVNNGSLSGVYSRSDSLEVPGLGISAHPLAEELENVAKCAASVKTPATDTDGQTQTEHSSSVEQSTRFDDTPGNEMPVERSCYINIRAQVELETIQPQVVKLIHLDAELQPSLGEVFEMMEPVTSVSKEDNVLLAPATYVDTDTQTNLTKKAETANEKIEESLQLLQPSIYADAGVQKDPEHIEVLRDILAEDPAILHAYASRVKKQGLLKTTTEELTLSSSDLSKEKQQNVFNWWPSSNESGPMYKIIGPRPRNLFKKMNDLGEATSSPEVAINPIEPAVRDFVFEHAEIIEAEGSASPELPGLSFSIRAQRCESADSPASSEEGTIFSIESNNSMPNEMSASFLSRSSDYSTRTDDNAQIDSSSVSINAKHPQALISDSPLSSVSCGRLPANGRQPDDFTSNAATSNTNTKRAPASNRPLSMSTSELPTKSKSDSEQVQPSMSQATYNAVSVKAVWPLCYHIVLGLLVIVFLTHAFYAEKRFWRNANELTRLAVVSMRDERWGSWWVEIIGYLLDQKLGVDRTGFC